MRKQNKYDYLLVIQQNYGAYGWEDVSIYEATSQGNCIEKTEITVFSERQGKTVKRMISLCKHDLKEYQTLGFPTRVIFRKELKEVPELIELN